MRSHFVYGSSMAAVSIASVFVLVGTVLPLRAHAQEKSDARAFLAGSRVRCGRTQVVDYVGKDGVRHRFPNPAVYGTWYTNLKGVKRLSDRVCATIPLGSNVRVRPGSVLVRFGNSPRIYAVSAPSVLRAVRSTEVARGVIPSRDAQHLDRAWKRALRTFPSSLRADYTMGASLRSPSEYHRKKEQAACQTIDECFGFAVRLSPPRTVSAPSAPPTARPAAVGVVDASRIVEVVPQKLPPLGERVAVPTFGTTVRRITDRAAQGGFGTHIYSQLQAFSPDARYVLLTGDEGYVVRRLDTLRRAADAGLQNINAPRWHPGLPHTVLFYDSNEDATLRVQSLNVQTGAVETLYTFPSTYERIRSNQSFDELSRDGQWMAGMASTVEGDQTIFALDVTSRMLGAQIPLGSLYDTGTCEKDPEYGVLEPDWVGVSPLGRFLVVQWKRDGTARCSGQETFDLRTGAFVGRTYDGHQHGDLGVDEEGKEFFMTFELSHPADPNRPGQGLRYLPGPPTGVAEPRYLELMEFGNQDHISCQGPDGLCLVTSGSDPANGYSPFEGEIWLQYTDGRVLRLAHHRSTSCGYWVQPRGSISANGRYVIFASDWAVARCAPSNENFGAGEAYILELPEGLAKRGLGKGE